MIEEADKQATDTKNVKIKYASDDKGMQVTFAVGNKRVRRSKRWKELRSMGGTLTPVTPGRQIMFT